ncbi:MAG: type II toxin-antitoxin system VapC family toxin [Pseudomonadota bacterium]
MIVVDTNTIAYLYLPTAETGTVEKLLELDDDWVAPQLWRSEFRNILALYVRKDILDFDTACQIQDQAEILMTGSEYEVDSLSVLAEANKSGCSAYDCEFVSLAQSLGIKLVTSDKKVLKAFPDLAATAKAYISRA